MRKFVAQSLVIVTLAALPAAAAEQKRIITPPGAKPGGNFSQGVLIDGTLYVVWPGWRGQGREDSRRRSRPR